MCEWLDRQRKDKNKYIVNVYIHFWYKQIDICNINAIKISELMNFYRTNNNICPATEVDAAVPEMRIWSILLIKSDLKWCIHLSRSLF